MDDTLGLDTSKHKQPHLVGYSRLFLKLFFSFKLKVILEFLIKINFKLTERSSFSSFCCELFRKTMEQ